MQRSLAYNAREALAQLTHMPPLCHPTPFGFIFLKSQMGCVLQSIIYKSEVSCRFLRLRACFLQSSFYNKRLSCRFLRCSGECPAINFLQVGTVLQVPAPEGVVPAFQFLQ